MDKRTITDLLAEWGLGEAAESGGYKSRNKPLPKDSYIRSISDKTPDKVSVMPKKFWNTEPTDSVEGDVDDPTYLRNSKKKEDDSGFKFGGE